MINGNIQVTNSRCPEERKTILTPGSRKPMKHTWHLKWTMKDRQEGRPEQEENGETRKEKGGAFRKKGQPRPRPGSLRATGRWPSGEDGGPLSALPLAPVFSRASSGLWTRLTMTFRSWTAWQARNCPSGGALPNSPCPLSHLGHSLFFYLNIFGIQ